MENKENNIGIICSEVTEGKATIFLHEEGKVFYNDIQQFNRDISIVGIQTFIKRKLKDINKLNLTNESLTNQNPRKKKCLSDKFSIFEALSATGLRSIRYALELENIDQIISNDINSEAIKLIDLNIKKNNIQNIVQHNLGDANNYLSTCNKKFDIIDLDPYGSSAPFIDSSIKSISDDGLLMATFTDAGVLAGTAYPEKCFSLYGGNNFGVSNIISESNHEAGLRLIVNMIANIAAKHKKTIEPLLCLSIDFYFRVFIMIKTSPIEVKSLSSKVGLIFACNGCGYKINQYLGRKNDKKKNFQSPLLEKGVTSNCKFCNSTFVIAGPLWMSKLHDDEFVKDMIDISQNLKESVYSTKKRMIGMLNLAYREIDNLFYFNLNDLSSIFKTAPISIDKFTKAITNLGYKVSLTHAKRNCVKTNADWETVLYIFIKWMENNNLLFLKKNDALDFDVNDENSKTSFEKSNNLSEKVLQKIYLLKQNINSNPNFFNTSIGKIIIDRLSKLSLKTIQIDFEKNNESSILLEEFRKVKMIRYQQNPKKNWGPGSKKKHLLKSHLV